MAIPVHYHSKGAVVGDFPTLAKAISDSDFTFSSKPVGAMPDGTMVQRYFATLNGRRIELTQGCEYGQSHGAVVAMAELLVLTFIGTMSEEQFPYYRYYFAPVTVRRYDEWLGHLGDMRRKTLEFRDYFNALFPVAPFSAFAASIVRDINAHNVVSGLKPYVAASR